MTLTRISIENFVGKGENVGDRGNFFLSFVQIVAVFFSTLPAKLKGTLGLRSDRLSVSLSESVFRNFFLNACRY